MRSHRTVGLSRIQCHELLRRVERLIDWDKPTGRPRKLTLTQALKATLMYFKNNLTQEVIAELLGVSQSVVSDTIATLEKAIEQALTEFVRDLAQVAADLAGRVALIDGSLHPCWSWADRKDLHSGKHKTTGHSHQYVCDLDGNLHYISDPLPGSTHDAKAFSAFDLADHFTASNSFADKGYLGCGPTTPFRKPPGGELLDWQKDFNTTVNRHRAAVERVIGNTKTWRAFHTDYRRPHAGYPQAFRTIRALHFFKLYS